MKNRVREFDPILRHARIMSKVESFKNVLLISSSLAHH